MSNWKFFLANSNDLSLEKDITFEARGKQLNLSHNRSGNLSFNLPLNGDNYDNTFTNKKCVIALKNKNIVWSGPIWTRNLDLNADKIEISAVGWFEILMYRHFYAEKTFTNIKDTTIAFDLLNTANADIPTWITAGSSASNVNRTITYNVWQSIGEEILALSDMESGFDLEVDPETRQLNLKPYNQFADRTNVPFGYNWGPNNISNIVIAENGGEMRNRVSVVGSNNMVKNYPYPPVSSASSSVSQSQTDNNLLAEIIEMTEVSDENVLNAIAESEGGIKEYPQVNYEITLKPQGPSNPYDFFEDYGLGDKIYFTAQKSVEGKNIVIEKAVRIFGASISIDENGKEVVSSLQTTFSG